MIGIQYTEKTKVFVICNEKKRAHARFFLNDMMFFALFKKIVALGYLIQQKYHNDIRNMLP